MSFRTAQRNPQLGWSRCPRPRWPHALPLRRSVRWSSISQRPGSDHVHFPGAVNSKFTTKLSFERPSTHATIPTFRVMDSDGVIVDKDRDPPDVSEEEVLTWYKNMLTVSIMDLIMFDAQRQGRLSFYMVSAGEEGIAVGSASALTPDDVIFAQYRETGVFQQRGFTLEDFMSQLFANRKDAGKGRNMPVHYGSSKLNIHTISSPLATQIPQASGAAYALKLQALTNPTLPPRIVACYFGEGAASEGDFHAALNIAATRACPVVFVCRNNGYAISTPTLEQYRGDGIASRGVGYGIDTVRVDGNDVFAVREVMGRARAMALEGGGRPVLVEAMSYRVEEVDGGEGVWDAEREGKARRRIRGEVLGAFARAEREKRPRLRGMFEDVYEEVTEEARGQMEELRGVLERYPEEYDVDEYEDGRDGL
ncbi:MAG: 2-oxoisovalerate dehydrogenase E1 alpha subunit [Lasallia pustulata]|uniref:2-oxoisovalerate dehydrogenase subunit alpha n=1 Tax=Lasallia pustulata TaxID=136370 RepID=A0A5M8PV91_9LECA|nr:MAG: 2-oxoisovalerate dehydrogenase E1 alpha subunit [Lasallia pustulata]